MHMYIHQGSASTQDGCAGPTTVCSESKWRLQQVASAHPLPPLLPLPPPLSLSLALSLSLSLSLSLFLSLSPSPSPSPSLSLSLSLSRLRRT